MAPLRKALPSLLSRVLRRSGDKSKGSDQPMATPENQNSPLAEPEIENSPLAKPENSSSSSIAEPGKQDPSPAAEPGNQSPSPPAEPGKQDPSPVAEPPIAEPEKQNSDKVFALIIGINDYKASDHFSTLQGAVNDAIEFRQYLLDSREKRGLQVPESNIVSLINEEATRDKILATFRSHFLDNPRIPNGGETTMILFFAGHGARVEARGNLMSVDEKVEGICPVDERTESPSYVHTIPDYVLGWLLRELALKKGPNITVIFDSCHSGGMGRDAGMARTPASHSPAVPLELDSHLWMGKNMVPSHGMWYSAATAHVLLAACGEKETAREVAFEKGWIRGRFTKSLVEELRKVDLEDTTYAELMDRLPSWSGQVPQCGGSRRNRVVFDGNYPATGRRAIPLLPHTTPGPEEPSNSRTFRVEMGAVEGVVPGTEFSALDKDNTVLCTLVAQSVDINYTILVTKNSREHDVSIPEGSRAVVSDWKNDTMTMHVYVPPEFPHTAALFPTERQSARHRFVRAPSLKHAAVMVRSEGNEIVIERLTSTILEYQRQTRFPFSASVGPSHLPAVMDGIAHFNFFLERRHGSLPISGVTLEMYRLKGEIPGREPDLAFGDKKTGNLVLKDEALFKSEAGAKYGFKICNASSFNLYPYLFYFDPTKYTIQMWYSPPSKKVEAPLKRSAGEVTVGMGGEAAFQFTLPAGVSKDSGFLKLFVSTQFLDLDWMEQIDSPFDAEYKGTGRLDVVREVLKQQETWDAYKVTLTMTSG
ncbi:caspase domain-containing protein [Mycena pura]|uniref:Caspase domain-containing protein n=1 Tax=Mycena pura TaxID=153505 RepID=A0AAD6VCN9_9AGAR|nr:caspase domain-containing protein [Mycena pura]